MRCFPRRCSPVLLRRAALRRRNFGTETEGPESRELDARTPKGMENAVPWWSIFANELFFCCFFGVFLFQVVKLFGFGCFGFEVGSWEFDRFSLTTLSIG